MSDRERQRRASTRAPRGMPSRDGDDDGLDVTRRRAELLLRTADDAIARALSGDSERFLQATRQSGGQ